MKYLFLSLLFTLTTFSTVAQSSILPTNDEEEVKNVLIELFDGYRVGDSLRVKNAFTSEATFQSAYITKQGESVLSKPKSIQNFVDYIGGELTKQHDERLRNIAVHIDKNLASVWAQYAFYLDGQFSHCGSENFLLTKEKGHWKIFHLVDTRQTSDCKIPDNLKNRY